MDGEGNVLHNVGMELHELVEHRRFGGMSHDENVARQLITEATTDTVDD